MKFTFGKTVPLVIFDGSRYEVRRSAKTTTAFATGLTAKEAEQKLSMLRDDWTQETRAQMVRQAKNFYNKQKSKQNSNFRPKKSWGEVIQA